MTQDSPDAPSSDRRAALCEAVLRTLGEGAVKLDSPPGELACEVPAARLLDAAAALRDEPALKFEMCMDVCGVDYLEYGRAEWKTSDATSSGFSRGVSDDLLPAGASEPPGRRFAVVYNLLSVSLNQRLRLRVYCPDNAQPIVDSVTGIWASADWFEREAFDLFGIMFRGHPDLRRLLTDYGFIGHPFRKDFPLSGNVEVRYDPEKGRVVYEPVSIEPRVLVPKVIRHDNRYDPQLTNASPNG
ncbi:MAG: NADH-quinone oxidoreductase subunit C [Gammaproteobacteria bacterium]|nr:NADH-quinone oxidoreductase subunit C [Gammaproteobacteria bacterium]